MEKYLALIRRTDFTDLYKYGRIFLNRLTVCNLKEHSIHQIGKDGLFSQLFERANSFESSFTYLVIEFESDSFDFDTPSVDIEEVTHVFPLDREAKKEFETSFDNHIKIEEPIWNDAYAQIQRIRTKRDCEKGADNVIRLFGFGDSSKICKEIIGDSVLDEVVSEVYSNKRPSGKLPVWVYLMRYERHSFFPQETLGFFMDAVYVVCNYLSQMEVSEDEVVNTAVIRFLEQIPKERRMKDIMAALQNSEVAKPFLQLVSKIDERVDFLNVAVLFLILRHRYSDGLRYEKDIVARFKTKDSIDKSFLLASYLVGIVLGHDKTYEALYENLPLRIYKSPEEMERVRKQQEYERWKAAEEMRRMEEDQRRQREDRHRGKNKTEKKGRKKGWQTDDAYYGGGLKQTSFPGHIEKPAETFIPPVERIEEPRPETPRTEPDNQPVTDTLFPENEFKEATVSFPQLPCVMGKLKKGSRTELCKTPKPVTVYSADEYQRLYDSGWRIKKD